MKWNVILDVLFWIHILEVFHLSRFPCLPSFLATQIVIDN
jgi:hypothetical protein